MSEDKQAQNTSPTDNNENYPEEEEFDENYQEGEFDENYQEGEFDENYQEEEEPFDENYQEGSPSYWGDGENTNTGSPVLIIDDDDDDLYDMQLTSLRMIENGFSALMYGNEVTLSPSKTFEIKVPRTFLPITLQVAYGFFQHEIAFNVKVEFADDWNSPYSKAYVTHPVSGHFYTGSALVKDSLSKFFNKDYQPKTYYRSAPYFFHSSADPDHSKIKDIEKAGFTSIQARRALSLCRNNLSDSLTFLRTGQIDMSEHLEDFKPPIPYKENPLIYLILEIADSIFDVQDHCSICRDPISPGIKPATCEKESCKYIYSDIGVGISLVQEIRRDTLVADLLYTSFLCAYETDFLTPAPPNLKVKEIAKLVKKIPSLAQVAAYKDDVSLCDAIGLQAFNLLRWIILSNRSQLFYLPPKIHLNMLSSNGCFQFMALISSPDQEEIFQQLKKKYGSIFSWHGSQSDRWHSIIRNGLINASNTKLMRCGAAYGPGIYLAHDSSVSMGYSGQSQNPWNASKLGRCFSVIALCEVINLPDGKTVTEKVYCRDPRNGNRVQKNISGVLTRHNNIFTLTLEEACIVRFIIVNLQKQHNIYTNPPSKLPTLIDVLESKCDKK